MSRNSESKKYTHNVQLAIKGESFFESLVSKYCIPHKIAGLKDLGIDFFCEWVCGDAPTGLLFGAQIKTRVNCKIIPYGRDMKHNGLEKFKIPSLTIDAQTKAYWRGLGIPTYLFLLAPTNNLADSFDTYYKRVTPVLIASKEDAKLVDYFYKVNKGLNLFVFADLKKKRGGFARDLYMDWTRWNYYKGSIYYLNPRSIGLAQFPEERTVFGKLFQEYQPQLIATYKVLQSFITTHLQAPKKNGHKPTSRARQVVKADQS